MDNKTFSYEINLTESQRGALEYWQSQQDEKVKKSQIDYGDSSGYAWVITPYTFGTSIHVENIITKERIDLTEYHSW